MNLLDCHESSDIDYSLGLQNFFKGPEGKWQRSEKGYRVSSPAPTALAR